MNNPAKQATPTRRANKIKKAVIPAAGLGTRLLPITKAVPKEMLPLGRRPAIHWIVAEAVQAGIEDILIITGRGKGIIEDYFDRSPELEAMLEQRGETELLAEIQQISRMAAIHYIRQQEPLGLGHAVLCAEAHVGQAPFAVLLPDDLALGAAPLLAQLMAVYGGPAASALSLQRVPQADTSRYGIVTTAGQQPNGAWTITNLVEKPRPEEAPSDLAVVGRYILHPAVFEFLRDTKPGAGGEIQLTDALRGLCAEYGMVGRELAGTRLDLGTPAGLLAANELVAAGGGHP